MKSRMATMAGVVALGVALGFLSVPPAAAAVAAAAAPAARCTLPVFGPGPSYHPHIDPSTFTANVTNQFFPLKPGRTLVYQGTKDGKSAIDVVAPSFATLVVDGVRTRVLEDRLYLNGRLEERTQDYYAQDACGDVWYFGEDTAVLDAHGNVVDTSGSFRAGVDGAQPGVFMTATTMVGRQFRQEWYVGQAEDTFMAVDPSTPVTVPYGSFNNALRTKETTALEPAVVDNKYYVRGIGQVREIAVKGPLEKLELVDVIN
ncbi:MAG: hypothetical protein DLM59_10605 [Pseudonocardiales bacterium]|nr:MAG: hypothetical protein DLM59_10605 [Pseudonocardiales bacterium]